jgi:hypothetical protein
LSRHPRWKRNYRRFLRNGWQNWLHLNRRNWLDLDIIVLFFLIWIFIWTTNELRPTIRLWKLMRDARCRFL